MTARSLHSALLLPLGLIIFLIINACRSEAPVVADEEETNIGAGTHGERAYSHTEKILSYGPRPPESTGLESVLKYATTSLRSAGWVVRRQSFQAPVPGGRQATFTNLIARHGSDSPELWSKPVSGLLCAHIDSKPMRKIRFLGADDAASAVAAILEIARHLNESAPEHADKLEIVFFDGEEAFGRDMGPVRGTNIFDGIYGSRYYASSWRSRGKLPTFGILLDMIGHKNLKIKLPADNNPPALAKALIEAGSKAGRPGTIVQGTTGVIDDHVPLNHAGIPTVDMIGDFTASDWWHTAKDDLSLISADSLDFSIRIVLHFLENQLAATKLSN